VPIDGSQPIAVALAGDRVRVLWADGTTIRLHENVKGAFPRDAQFPVPTPVRALALSPSGVLAVAACADGSLWMLNAGTGEFSPPVAAGDQTARAVAVATDHGPVVAAFGDTIRRYDLAERTWDLVGDGPGSVIVAVSPDGATAIAASTRRWLFRWNLPGAEWTGSRDLKTAVTAIAVDGTGDRVLAGLADGTLWLYDMSGGSPEEFGTPKAPPSPAWQGREQTLAVSPPPAPVAPGAPPPSQESAEPGGSSARLTDNDVRFTVYRPQAIPAGIWASLLVFAHKTDLVEEPGKPPLDPNAQVEAIARAHFGRTPVPPAATDSRRGVLRGTRLRITADLPGLHCNPASAEFDWWEPVHHVVFRLLAMPDLVGSVVRGAVRVWRGPLILGEVSVAISIVASLPSEPSRTVADSAARYHKVFPSYSHADGAIVDHVIDVARTLGNEYLRDAVALRVGERWRERLPQLIEEADIFQLFWSSNSMRSPYCRHEWEYALSLGRPLFVLPTYWEDPRPSDPANGLPPPALASLQFVKMSVSAAEGVIPPAEPDHAPPTREYPIPVVVRAAAAEEPAEAAAEEAAREPPTVHKQEWPPPEYTRSREPMAPPQGRYDVGYDQRAAPSTPAGYPRHSAPLLRARYVVAALVTVAVVVAIIVFILKG
jgi:hypothetical protein